MPKRTIITNALANSLWTSLYIILVATFLNNAQTIFGKEEPHGALVPMAMLTLLVFSAAVCGSLVFGRPVLWYMDGKKKEALRLFIYTLAFLFVVLVILFAVVYALR